VSRIDLPEDAGFIALELQVKSLDELKNRILRLVLVVLIKESGLLARAVFVLDRKGKGGHAEYVPEGYPGAETTTRLWPPSRRRCSVGRPARSSVPVQPGRCKHRRRGVPTAPLACARSA